MAASLRTSYLNPNQRPKKFVLDNCHFVTHVYDVLNMIKYFKLKHNVDLTALSSIIIIFFLLLLLLFSTGELCFIQVLVAELFIYPKVASLRRTTLPWRTIIIGEWSDGTMPLSVLVSNLLEKGTGPFLVR